MWYNSASTTAHPVSHDTVPIPGTIRLPMPNKSILILNPKGDSGNRTSINRARRYNKKGSAVWVAYGVSIRFVDPSDTPITVSVAKTGPRKMMPARFIITQEMIRSVNLRTCTPIWPSQQEMKDKEGREERLAERRRKREAIANAV